MRLKGSTSAFQEERDKDLIRAYREQLSLQKDRISLPDVLRATVNSPSAKFWTTIERAMAVVTQMRRGQDTKVMMPLRLEMYKEIARRVDAVIEKDPNVDLESAVIMVVEGGAPKFYLTPKSAKTIIHNIRKRWRMQKQKR